MTLPHPAGSSFQHPFGKVPHYYGDVVRSLFLAAAVLTGLSIPFYANVYAGAVVCAPIIVVLLILAGLMSPQAKTTMIVSVVVAAVGLVLAQLGAVGAYDVASYVQFVILELLSLAFIVALYFGVKDVRAMMTGKIGKIDEDDSEYRMPHDVV